MTQEVSLVTQEVSRDSGGESLVFFSSNAFRKSDRSYGPPSRKTMIIVKKLNGKKMETNGHSTIR